MSISLKFRLLLWYHKTFHKLDFSSITPQEFRSFSDDYTDTGNILDGPTIPVHDVENRTIQGREGDIPIRIFKPNNSDNLPIIVFFHGGGFVIGTLDTHDNVCRRLCRDNQAIVVSVDYRLAPEHKYPTPTNDCYDATVWVSNNCHSFGGDANRLAVMGDSAGGNLATVVALKARDLNGPKIAFQVLVYPSTDARLLHPSITKNGKGYLLTEEMLNWFVRQYTSSDEQKYDPYMSPYLAEDLSNMPPTLIQVAEYDPLRDDGTTYAKRLIEAGNKVFLTEYKGLFHTFLTMPKFSKRCLAAYHEIRDVLSREL